MRRREFIRSVGMGVALGANLKTVLGSSFAFGQDNAGTTAPFPKIVHHGLILGKPAKPPEGTKNPVSYELGEIMQLDRTHCLLLASMDEQGGPDLCVGNDAFIFEKLSDIKAENAIPINRVETNYKLKSAEGLGFLVKYPVTGAFIPLGAQLEDGRPHPAAGTGILVSGCMAFKFDRSDPVGQKGMDSYNSWETLTEVIQLKWTGEKLLITDVHKAKTWFGHTPLDQPLSMFYPIGAGLVAPFRFEDGYHHVVRFDWDGKAWSPSKVGPPFQLNDQEKEPSIQRRGDLYYISTRGSKGPKNRMYVSKDGIDFKFLFDFDSVQDTPLALNKGLDGSLYLATNRNKGWFRNPLSLYPMVGDSFGEGVILHDQDGVRDDTGAKLPFVDHARGNNVFLEGRWRHLICYRVCELKERTLYGFQQNVIKKVYGESGKPIPKLPTSGLYIAELMYDRITTKPFLGNTST